MGQRTCTVYVPSSILLGTRKMRGGWCYGFLPAHTLSATALDPQMPPKISSGWSPQIEPGIRRTLSGTASRHRTIEVTESMLRSLLPLVTQKLGQRIRLRSESVWFIYLCCVNGGQLPEGICISHCPYCSFLFWFLFNRLQNLLSPGIPTQYQSCLSPHHSLYFLPW